MYPDHYTELWGDQVGSRDVLWIQVWQEGRALQCQTQTTRRPTHPSGRGLSPHPTCTVLQHVSCHFISSSQLIKTLNHWRSKYCKERRAVETAQWTMNSNKRTNGTEEMTSVCFPQNQMYSSGDKFRSVSQTALLHLLLSDVHVLSLQVGVQQERKMAHF